LILGSRKKEVYTELKELPSVSIIIPAYNEEKTIIKTIKSAIASEYPEKKLEVIVVNDGSKDKTYQVAKSFKHSRVKVFTKKNGGKGSALNYGIKHSKGEIIVTMDADSMVEPGALKLMVQRFADPKVMCTGPTVTVHKPRGILQRVQQIEYLLGVFLRKAFESMNAIHVTPGAFSSYRRSFLKKHGLFDENNLTEDLEMALRIQANHYKIAYSPKSVVETNSPNTFNSLLIQRKRWYAGLVKNLWNYKRLFSKKYGELGLIVMPMAILTIIFTVSLTTYLAIDSMFRLKKEFLLLKSINYSFSNFFSFNSYAINRFFLNFFSRAYAVFFVIFVLFTIGYVIYAKSQAKNRSYPTSISVPIFLIFYAGMFSLWWIITFVYLLLNKKVVWR
jgi:cellulose synthase/poly-beta-1,6-N-acetylglucosamine synthase-like glycosyltransferase